MSGAALSGTNGLVAVAAAAVAVAAVAWCIVLTARLRRMRHDQRVVLGQDEERDLAEHAASLQQAFEALQDYVGDVAERLDGRLGDVEQSLQQTISHRSLLHYDAYNELSGKQSMSIALLDGTRSGIVLTCIHHRDQARVYAKQVQAGAGLRELSPEEAEAVRIASTRPPAGEDVDEPAA